MTLTPVLRTVFACGLGAVLVAATPPKRAGRCAARTANSCERHAGCVWSHKACKTGSTKTAAHRHLAKSHAIARRDAAEAKDDAALEELKPPPSETPSSIASGVNDDY